jgi:hypothetical protein
VQVVVKTQHKGVQDARINGIAVETVRSNHGKDTSHCVTLYTVTSKKMLLKAKKHRMIRLKNKKVRDKTKNQ